MPLIDIYLHSSGYLKSSNFRYSYCNQEKNLACDLLLKTLPQLQEPSVAAFVFEINVKLNGVKSVDKSQCEIVYCGWHWLKPHLMFHDCVIKMHYFSKHKCYQLFFQSIFSILACTKLLQTASTYTSISCILLRCIACKLSTIFYTIVINIGLWRQYHDMIWS